VWAKAHLPPDAVLMTRRAAETRYFSGRAVVATPSAPFADLMAYAARHGVTHIVLSDDDRNGAPNLVQGIRVFPQHFGAVYAADDIRIVQLRGGAPPPLRADLDLYAGKTTGRPERLFDWNRLSFADGGIIAEHLRVGWGTVLAAVATPQPPVPVQSTMANLRAGDVIALDSIEAAPIALSRGEEVQVTLNWRALAATAANYVVFVHLLDAHGALIAQRDAPPLNGARPTFQWEPGEWVEDRIALQVPADAAPGEYRLAIGLYDGGTGRRLPLTAPDGTHLADDRLLVEGLRVNP
jgi:hypothetical protein